MVKPPEPIELVHVAVKINLAEAVEIIHEELDANEWGNIVVENPLLEFVPFFYFHYHSFVESTDENKTKNVEESTEGISCVNAVSSALDDAAAENISPESLLKSFIPIEKAVFKIKEPRLNGEEARAIAQIKIAAQEHVPKVNVLISGMRLVYLPSWIFKVELDEEPLTLRMSAFSGELDEGAEIPYRGKSHGEVLKETLSDLKSPSGWIDYFREWLTHVVLVFQPHKEHPNRLGVVVVLVFILLVLLAIGFIQWPSLP
ncbi:MAG: hypothetical protein AABY11_01425 [archaeon]